MKDIYSEQIKKRKQELYQDKQNFQIQKECWEKSFSEQKKRLEQAIEFFKQYNQNYEKKMIKSKEEEKKNQIKENYKNKDIQLQIDSLKSLYNIKLKKFSETKKNFQDEKEKFEKYKTDINNNIDIKRIEIEKKNLDLLQINSELNQRNNELKNKEMYLKDKYEDYFRIKNIVEAKEKQNMLYERDIKLAAERIVKYMDEITEKENFIEKEKAELIKKSSEVNKHQKQIEDEKMNIEQEKAELNLRYQYLNTFSYKSPNLIFNNDDLIVQRKFDNNDIILNDYNQENGNNYNIINFDIGQYNNKFNANRYINSVKDRIENGKRIYYDNYKINENRLDIAQERQYIKKCNGALNKNKQV